MRQGWKRTLAGMLAGAVCAGALPGVPLMAEETEAARGRYLESDAALPEGLFEMCIRDRCVTRSVPPAEDIPEEAPYCFQPDGTAALR